MTDDERVCMKALSEIANMDRDPDPVPTDDMPLLTIDLREVVVGLQPNGN